MMRTLDSYLQNTTRQLTISQFSPRVQVKLEQGTQRRARKLLSDWEKRMTGLRLATFKLRSPSDETEMMWDALDAEAIGTCAPLEKHTITASVGEMREGKPRAVAMEELDWELLDFE